MRNHSPDPEPWSDEEDKGEETCPVCGGTEAHADDCDICPECSGDCSAKGRGHSVDCSSWEPTDEQMNPPEWGPTISEQQEKNRRLK